MKKFVFAALFAVSSFAFAHISDECVEMIGEEGEEAAEICALETHDHEHADEEMVEAVEEEIEAAVEEEAMFEAAEEDLEE